MKTLQKSPVAYLTIDEAFAGQRIDNFLITRLKTVPKTHIYRILRKGEVRVNKKRAAASYRLQSGDILRIPPLTLEPEKKSTFIPHELKELLQPRIIFEDKQLLIINKPPGIAVHGGSKSPWGVVEVLRLMYPQYPHLELAHRLDLDTSGCLILAKKRSALRELHELMRNGQMTKIYWALTKGTWSARELEVDLPLQKNFLSSGERIVKVDKTGKASQTIFQPIEKYKTSTLVTARLLTGRTHQIRVHAQYQKHPVAGDEKYGDREFNKEMRQFGLKRLFLHAYSLEFTLASTGQVVQVTAELEPDLRECLDNLI